MRAILSGSVALVVLLGAASAPASAAGRTASWHRLNIYNDPAEHERFRCVVLGAWTCLYDKVPAPNLGLHWDSTRGLFHGVVSTSTWVCPDWFPADACAGADTTVSGTTTFIPPHGQGIFSVDQTLLVSNDGRLWIYWADNFQFVCPWYPTFADAQTNDETCEFAP